MSFSDCLISYVVTNYVLLLSSMHTLSVLSSSSISLMTSFLLLLTYLVILVYLVTVELGGEG